MYKKIGTVDGQGVFVEATVETKEKGLCLSIHADIKRSGHIVGAGQCIDTVRDVYQRGKLAIPYKQVRQLVRIWERWHLNDMQAGCEHQREAGWTSYTEHPSQACWVCGYEYGTAWLIEELPEEVIAFVEEFNS